MRRPIAATLAAISALACAGPAVHTPEPYASNPAAASGLEARAAEYCSELHPAPGQQPTRPFVTDGCSRWFDRDWSTECCVAHDIAYWCGGSRAQRRAADEALGECVAANAGPLLGLGMNLGVRFGGHPVFPTSYRWGYGHAYRALYPSTAAQRERREPAPQ